MKFVNNYFFCKTQKNLAFYAFPLGIIIGTIINLCCFGSWIGKRLILSHFTSTFRNGMIDKVFEHLGLGSLKFEGQFLHFEIVGGSFSDKIKVLAISK